MVRIKTRLHVINLCKKGNYRVYFSHSMGHCLIVRVFILFRWFCHIRVASEIR